MPSESGSQPTEDALIEWISTKPIHVLYVEDNLEYAAWLKSVLEASFTTIEMEIIADPEIVQEFLAEHTVDCILADHILPGKNGVDLLIDLNETHEELPFIMLTGHGSEHIARKAIRHGATDYLPKALVTEEPPILAERIQGAVSNHRRDQYVSQLHRIQQVTSEINRRLVTAKTLEDIDQAVCEVISEAHPYVFAWIGEHETDRQVVTPRAYAGVEAGYLDEITITTDETNSAEGPTGRAIRHGEIAVMQDIPNDPRYEPWREQAMERGYRSSAAVPLQHDDTLYGVVNVYSDRVHAFADPEVRLLETLGETIATAMHRLALQEELRRATAAVDNAADAIFITNTEGIIEYVNPAFELLTGYDAKEALKQTPRLLKSEEMSEDCYESMWDSMRSGDVWDGEVTNERQSGETFIAEQTVAPITNDDGDIQGFVAVQRDVTQRRNRQREIEKQRNRLRVLFDEAPDGIVVHDEAGKVLDVNQTLAQMLGYSRDDLLSMNVLEFEVGLPPHELRTQWEAMDPGAMEKLEVVGRHRRSDGSTYPVEVWVSRVDIDSENQCIALIRDISNRKKREQRLELFERAIEEAGHAIIITNRDGEIEYVNPIFEHMTGYTSSESVGRTPRILKSGKHGNEFYSEMWETILGGEIWRAELINRAADGRQFNVDQTIAPVTDTDGEITHFVGVLNDITDRRLNQQRLDVFMRILRHNLRNSMNIVLGHAHHILEDHKEETITKPTETILFQANRLVELSEKAQLIDQIFYMPEGEGRSNIDLDTCMNEVIDEIENEYPTASISVQGRTQELVCGDERLRYAIREAMENAIEHNDQEHPQIEISIQATKESANGFYEVVIADNGPGIPNEQQEVIQSGEETPLTHGSGLGLWLIEWAIASLGGEVTFEENSPRGTRVILRIPSVFTGSQLSV